MNPFRCEWWLGK